MSNQKNELLEKLRKDRKHVNVEVTQNKSKNIIAYCRVSDSKQINNYSPEAQLAYIKRGAIENEWKIVKTFTILGESSKRGSKRPSIDELLKYIKETKHNIHAIVVFHSNRFTRDGGFGTQFLEKIIPKGIGFIDLSDVNDIFEEGGFIRQVDAFYGAQKDNLTRKNFINAITLEKLKQGYTMRRPPRGYKLFKTNRTRKKNQRVIITKEGELILQAFQMKLHYNYSNVLISEIMKSRGLKITSKALGEIFRNVYYCGFIKDKRLTEYNGYVEGRHPAMVTPEEFEIINYSKERKRQIRKKEVEQLPLRKHLICSNCNQKLTGYKASNRKNLFYYKCSTIGCNVNIKNEILHNLYLEKLKTFSFNKYYLPQLKIVLDEVFKMINESNFKLKKDINSRITNLEKERFLAIRNINANPEYGNELKELIDYCDDDLADLKEQLSKVKVGIIEIKKDGTKALNFINDLSSIWSESDFIFKTKLQELIFPDGIWYNKTSNKLVAPKINPIFNIINDLCFCLNENSRKINIKNSNKYSHNCNEKRIKPRTSNILNNMLITPSIIGSYEHHLKVLRQEKTSLVVLLSDRSNNYGNELIDSMNDLVSFIELYINKK